MNLLDFEVKGQRSSS